MRCTGHIECIDATLASLAREEGALRLRLGQLLEVLGRGAVFELGFSSLGAYAVERCERSVRWAEAARCLARRVEGLPELRRAMATGKVSWTMGEVLARVATPADETSWLALAEGRTVRQMRQRVDDALRSARAAHTTRTKARAVTIEQPVIRADGAAPPVADGTSVEQDTADGELHHYPAQPWASDDVDLCILTCTVDREDAWLFEATRCLLEQLGERGAAAQGEALLAEAQGTLLASLPRGAIDVGSSLGVDEAQQRWREQLRRSRDEAELACEQTILGDLGPDRAARLSAMPNPIAGAAALGIAPLEHATGVVLDRQVRCLAGALAGHELELSQLVLRFQRAGGWRRLGYATEAQYARERLGLSRSGLAARRALALRLERLPRVAAALGMNQLGLEAALQLVRVATPKTEATWIVRASRRTIKQLREEVAAALVAVRLAGERNCPPPEDEEMAAFQTLEQTVVSGSFGQCLGDQPVGNRPNDGPGPFGSAPSFGSGPELVEPATEARKAWHVMLGSLMSWLASGFQMSAAPHPASSSVCSFAGRVTLRLRMSRETCAWWRGLEAQARRWLPRGMSWVRYLCLSLWQGWRHLLGAQVAYGHIYVRDRYRCTSPVCNRRDVTPHHIRFRSAGGSDEDENVTSICTWCHLYGVHGGRIRATGTAARIRWELGPKGSPLLVVDGRERQWSVTDSRTAWPV